jgi:integrase
MGSVDIPYYVVKKGYGYWQPKKAMREAGFRSVPCGKDGPTAWKVAQEWNERWQRHRRGEERLEGSAWPAGTFGDAFDRYRKTTVWADKASRTREEWERGFDRIAPYFGDMRPTDAGVTLESVSAMRDKVKQKVSAREAWRTIKIWRAIWNVAVAFQFTGGRKDPSLGFQNSQPVARSASWTYREAATLVKQAWRMGYKGLAAIIAVTWDTMMSPVDVRSLRKDQLITDAAGAYFKTGRAKTGQAAVGTLSKITEKVVSAYLAAAPIDAGLLFRNRSGAPYSRFTLPDDFKAVRDAAFPKDTRTLADMRRSGAIEARAGGADPATLSAKMANNISVSNALHKAYQPVDLAAVRQADKARRQGRKLIATGQISRKKLAAIVENSNKDDPDDGTIVG